MLRALLSTSSIFDNNASATTAQIPAWNIGAGSLLIVAIRTETADATLTVNDSNGGTWYAIKVRNQVNVWIAYSWNHPGGTGVLITATFSAAQAYRKMQGIELSGGDSSDPFIAGATVQTTGSPLALNHSVAFSGRATVVSLQGNFTGTNYSVTSGTKFTATTPHFCGTYTLSSLSPVVHQNSTALGATANLSVAFADVADAVSPTFAGGITVDATTSSTITDTVPTASDNTAVTGYEGRINGGAWQDMGLSQSKAWSSLSQLTAYTREYRAYDSDGNRSAILSVTTSTYRAGASAGSIVTATAPQDGNPAGPLYALAQTLPVDAWVSYRTVSGPTPAGGTLDAQANGAFSYTGPAPAVWTIQPEINGVDHTDTVVVTLYDQEGGGGGPAPDTTGPTWAGPISLLDRGTTTATLQLPTATDSSGAVSYQYSLNGGAWQSTGTTVNLTGLTEATSYTLDARALDAVPNYSMVLSAAFTTRSSVVTGPPTERWNGTQWASGGVFRRGNGSGGFVTGGRPRRWNGTGWT